MLLLVGEVSLLVVTDDTIGIVPNIGRGALVDTGFSFVVVVVVVVMGDRLDVIPNSG